LQKPSVLAEIQSHISKAAPFGKPLDTNFSNLNTMIKQGFPVQEGLTQRRPGWKPYLYRGKQRLEFIIQEKMQCVQYDKESVRDSWNIFGAILCRVITK
jgi:AP-5 complex subunit mu-1